MDLSMLLLESDLAEEQEAALLVLLLQPCSCCHKAAVCAPVQGFVWTVLGVQQVHISCAYFMLLMHIMRCGVNMLPSEEEASSCVEYQ